MKSNPTYTAPFLTNSVEVTSPKTFPVNNPTDNSFLWKASTASLSNAEKATQAAAAAAAATASAAATFPAWSRTKCVKLRELIGNFQTILGRRRDELVECMVLETGATPAWVLFNVSLGIDFLEHVAETVVTISGSIGEDMSEGRAAYITKEPYGVVLEIVPWNGPFPLFLRVVFLSVPCGNNTVVVNPSGTSPHLHFLVASVAVEAGFPPGIINIISHSREDAVDITDALLEHDVVSFCTLQEACREGWGVLEADSNRTGMEGA